VECLITFQDYGKVEVVCIAPHLNKKRYYCVSVEAGLFGPVLVGTWGRIGWKNLRRIEQFFPEGSLSQVLDKANRVLAVKMRRGYTMSGAQSETQDRLLLSCAKLLMEKYEE